MLNCCCCRCCCCCVVVVAVAAVVVVVAVAAVVLVVVVLAVVAAAVAAVLAVLLSLTLFVFLLCLVGYCFCLFVSFLVGGRVTHFGLRQSSVYPERDGMQVLISLRQSNLP